MTDATSGSCTTASFVDFPFRQPRGAGRPQRRSSRCGWDQGLTSTPERPREVGEVAGVGAPAPAAISVPRWVTEDFLAHKKIAVTGVSRSPDDHGADVVCKRLRERGYEVFAINLNADRVENDPCYHNLKSVPGGVEAVVIGTRPEYAEGTMRECVELGIGHVWMHRLFGTGSVSPRPRSTADATASRSSTVAAR